MGIEGRGSDFGSNLGSDVGNLGRKAGDKMSDQANKIADKLHNAVDSASDRASEFATRARSSLDGWVRDLGAVMERHPIATIAIGFSAGYVLAKIRGRD